MIQVANAPCSWGILEFDLDGQAAGYGQVLDEMQQTGYAGTELGDWGFLPTNPSELKKELEQRELQMLGAFVPVAFADKNKHESGIKTALKIAKLMTSAGYEQSFIILADDNGKDAVRTQNAGRVQTDMGLNEERWKVFAEGTQKVARAVLEQTGLRCVFHHHCGGFIETPAEVEKLMDGTDSQLMGLCLDMGHYRFGGGDPLEALQQFSSRIWHVHFKDCRPSVAEQSRVNKWDYFNSVREGVFCELGKGEVDFPAIVNKLRSLEYNGWITVEQDVLPGMGSPKVCAAHNRDFIKGLGL